MIQKKHSETIIELKEDEFKIANFEVHDVILLVRFQVEIYITPSKNQL